VQRFADINIAKAGDDTLVQQCCLEAGFLSGAGARQHYCIEFITERLRAQAAQQRLGIELIPRHNLHRAEPPRIVEGDDRPRRHVKHHMVMRLVLGALVIVGAGRRLPFLLENVERAGHAEVHHQHVAR